MTSPTDTAPGSAGQNGAHTRQWPDNIVGGDITYGQATNYGGFYLADVDHGIPTIGAVTDVKAPLSIRGQRVEIFNYPGQTEAIAAQLVHRWNCHPRLLEALQKAKAALNGAPNSIELHRIINAAIAAATGEKW